VVSLLESPTNKRSKIIYSINKSTRNKNSPSRSRNFLYQNESQVNFKKSQDSKRSKKSTSLSKHLGSHYVDQNILDSAFLSSIGPLPEIFPYQDEGKDGVQVPIIRSQESSFHVSRKRPPRRSDFTNDDMHGNIVKPENSAVQDFNMT